MHSPHYHARVWSLAISGPKSAATFKVEPNAIFGSEHVVLAISMDTDCTIVYNVILKIVTIV